MANSSEFAVFIRLLNGLGIKMPFGGLVLASSNSQQQDMSISSRSPSSEPDSSIAGSDEVPELEEMQDTNLESESDSDKESGQEPKTTEIIDIARQAERMNGSRFERSSWLRAQFDTLMEQDRQELLEQGKSESDVEDQKFRYVSIILDRIELCDFYAGRD